MTPEEYAQFILSELRMHNMEKNFLMIRRTLQKAISQERERCINLALSCEDDVTADAIRGIHEVKIDSEVMNRSAEDVLANPPKFPELKKP